MMARKPVSVFKRPTTKPGHYAYYVKLWNDATGSYTTARSAAAVAQELHLDLKKFSPTSRTGAYLIGEELRKRGYQAPSTQIPLLADYCELIWDWEKSPYIQGKLARGQRIGREYVAGNAACIKNYVRDAFPSLRLNEVRLFMLEEFSMKLKSEAGLSNRRINGILSAVTVPLHEAARLGLIETDPAAGIRKLGNDTTEKGIPTSEEVRALVSLKDLDFRIRASILLGISCGLRAGEVQAIRLEDVSETTLTVRHSWSKFEGLKSTKTNRIRIVPLPKIVHDVLVSLSESNPHEQSAFLIFGKNPEAPLDIRALERGFYSALEKIGIDETQRNARNLSFHSLRHWNNSMLRGSIPDAKLRLLTGHSGEDMTNRYDHATDEDIRELSLAQERKIVPLISAAPIVG